MNSLTRISTLALVAMLALTACTDREAEAENARREAEAKARAEAARKEMEALPETFKPRYNRKLEPDTPPPSPPKEEAKADASPKE